MDNSITLPYWLFALLLVTALLLVLDRILLPGFRWYLRRRVNRVIAEVNNRLDIEIRPFQLTRKQVLVDQLLFDDKVVEAIKAHAAKHGMPKEVVQDKVARYANEIVPSFNALIYFRFGYWLAKTISRMLYRVRLGFYDQQKLALIDPEASVVFVMNHRSNMDYMLLSFLIAERTALSYAVGEWARIWPLQTLIRAMGAFFVRRNSGNALYRRVLERYVNLATRAGVCQAVFLEGGLTRDGTLGQPRQGFLDYMLRDYQAGKDRDVIFVPVGINYDRVIEDHSLLRKLDSEAERKSFWFVLKTSFRFGVKTLLMERRKRWLRFGYASVNLGRPLSIQEFSQSGSVDFSGFNQDTRFEQVELLSKTLMQRISEVIPILPVALMSEVLLQNSAEPLSELDLKKRAVDRIQQLREQGAPIRLSVNVEEGVLARALTMLEGRGFVTASDGLYRVSEPGVELLKYYANSIRQWSDLPSS